MKTLCSVSALLVFCMAGTIQAAPVTIDFEGFPPNTPLPPGAPLPFGAIEDGYFLTDIGAGGIVQVPPFGAPPPVPSVGFGPTPGSPGDSPDLEITKVGGGLFEFLAFDFYGIGTIFSGFTPVPTTVTGFLGAAVVGVDVFIPGPLAAPPPGPLVPFTPTLLAGVMVDKLVFDMGTGFVDPHVIDNIVLDMPITTPPPVPEPTSMALFGLTAFGMGVMRRRRKKVTEEVV